MSSSRILKRAIGSLLPPSSSQPSPSGKVDAEHIASDADPKPEPESHVSPIRSGASTSNLKSGPSVKQLVKTRDSAGQNTLAAPIRSHPLKSDKVPSSSKVEPSAPGVDVDGSNTKEFPSNDSHNLDLKQKNINGKRVVSSPQG